MNWIRPGLALGIAFAAALSFYPALSLGRRARTVPWLASSSVVALAPCLVPLYANPLRFLATLIAAELLVKLYDAHLGSRPDPPLGFWESLAYLPNWFWLVLSRKPKPLPWGTDLRLLGTRVVAALVLGVGTISLFCLDFSSVPFFVEHALKVMVAVPTAIVMGNMASSAFRLLGEPALDFGGNPFAATPAEFWRRWNRPAQQFFYEHVFLPAAGTRRPVIATLVTFAVSGLIHEYVFGIASGVIQGRQMLFFCLQGCAVVGTIRFRPKGWSRPLWIAGTLAFNLASSVFFFRSVDQILPFYWPP